MHIVNFYLQIVEHLQNYFGHKRVRVLHLCTSGCGLIHKDHELKLVAYYFHLINQINQVDQVDAYAHPSTFSATVQVFRVATFWLPGDFCVPFLRPVHVLNGEQCDFSEQILCRFVDQSSAKEKLTEVGQQNKIDIADGQTELGIVDVVKVDLQSQIFDVAVQQFDRQVQRVDGTFLHVKVIQ